ncbi:MAG TPA: XdhC family protein [Steroidobacteraceae bacterium]|nr:XdhC family protein [Steroidobacteraceae bacterium]
MECALAPLLPLLERERASGGTLALGILVHTAGSTYRKAGALVLIAANGDYAGLISGGCLEGDLAEHARAVMASGEARLVKYDLRSADDLIWGLGLGCEGAMHILLVRLAPENDYQPLAFLERALRAHAACAIGVVCESHDERARVGSLALPGSPAPDALATPAVAAALGACAISGETRWLELQSLRLFVLPLWLPPRVLILGAGPDALPVVEFAARLGWKLSLVDHRPAYAVAAHFPQAQAVALVHPPDLAGALNLGAFDAAVVMSHHLASDLAYLRALCTCAIPYVGLLGPAVRRERLLGELGADAELLRGRLHAPVGLPLGGRTPEAIALAIVAELQSFLSAHRRAGHTPGRVVHA